MNLNDRLRIRMNEYKWRVDAARRDVERALATGRRFYVSWSGGKDSTATLHLVIGFDPSIPILHIRNDYQLPDTTEFIASLAKSWKMNLTEVDCGVDYLDLCRTYGLPHMRSRETQAAAVHKIKKDVASEWAIKQGFNGLFWGLRGDESKSRRAMMRTKPKGLLDRNGILRIAPLGQWTSADVWAYHEEHGIPHAGCYDKENTGQTRDTIRNTGWLSTDGETHGRLEWLKRNYPHQYAALKELRLCPM